MAIETSNKKKGIKRGWTNKLKKLPEKKEMASVNENSAFDLDVSFSSKESQGNTLSVGPCTRDGAAAEFRWSLEVDGGIISRSPRQRRSTMNNNRFSTFTDEELYVSDEFNVADEINSEKEIARDSNITGKSSTTSKSKKNKKKKQKSGSTEKRSSSKSTSTKKTGDSSSKSSKTKSRSSSKSLSKTKKKKKKSLRQSTDVGSGSDNAKSESAKPSGETRTLLEDSVEQPSNSSDVLSKPPRKVTLLDQTAETDSFAETEETEASTEGDGQFETPPLASTLSGHSDNDNRKQWSPRPSDGHSILKNKIRASLASLGEQSDLPTLTIECSTRSSEVSRISQLWAPRTSDRHSIFKNKVRASLASLGERSAMSALMIECGSARSSEVSHNSNRPSQTSSDHAFLEAFHSEDRESVLGRLSVQDKDMMESLLNELQQYESQLEEERSEISKERCMMQLKQEAVEQMLEVEMDKNSRLEYQVLDLQERLDHYEKAKEDNELVQTIKMLKAEVELLRQKTERQDQAMANMALKAKRNQESHHDSTAVSIQNLPGKEQGELLMLRCAFEEQAKELAKMKEQIRSTKEDQTAQGLKQAVKNEEQQKKYFMKETQRLKKLLGNQFNQSNKKKSKGWFGSMSDNDECLLDLGDTSMVFGSVSDIGDCAAVPENDDTSTTWMEGSSSWMGMTSESLQEESSSSWMATSDL